MENYKESQEPDPAPFALEYVRTNLKKVALGQDIPAPPPEQHVEIVQFVQMLIQLFHDLKDITTAVYGSDKAEKIIDGEGFEQEMLIDEHLKFFNDMLTNLYLIQNEQRRE